MFQFPESQLFDETVALDIAFGPKNFGVSEEESARLASEMLKLVGLDDSYLERSRLIFQEDKCDVWPLREFWQWNLKC